MKRVGLMFAGQGAQSVGMGRDLWERSAAARAVFARADAVLGRDLTAVCFEGPAAALTASATCQPAILTVSLACLAAWREHDPGIAPVVCGGLSLGELTALTAAGVWDVDDALRLVAERGRLMDEACRAQDGGMAAVIGAETGLVERLCAEHGVDVANYNCPGQVVISGERARLAATVTALAAAGVSRVVTLAVAGAYHSRLMAGAAAGFGEVLAPVVLRRPACPVAQNTTGALTTEPEAIRAQLQAQVSGSVRWEACVRAMLGLGVDLLVELGPGKVLSGFVRRIDRQVAVCAVGSYPDLEAAGTLLGAGA